MSTPECTCGGDGIAGNKHQLTCAIVIAAVVAGTVQDYVLRHKEASCSEFLCLPEVKPEHYEVIAKDDREAPKRIWLQRSPDGSFDNRIWTKGDVEYVRADTQAKRECPSCEVELSLYCPHCQQEFEQ